MKKNYFWPKKAVVVYVPSIDPEGKMEELTVIDPLFPNIEEAAEYVNVFKNGCEAVIVLEMKLVRKWPVRPECRKTPNFPYTPRMRNDSFLRLLSQNRQFVVLATLEMESEHATPVTAGAFRKGVDSDIDLFLQIADWPVTPSYESAAIYETKRIYGWDMENRRELPESGMETEENVIFGWKKV